MDTDDDKDLKPPLSNVTNSTVNSAVPSAPNNTNLTSTKVKEEIKEEPMEIETVTTTQEKKSTSDQEKRPESSLAEDNETPMVNGNLSDSEPEISVSVESSFCVSAVRITIM